MKGLILSFFFEIDRSCRKSGLLLTVHDRGKLVPVWTLDRVALKLRKVKGQAICDFREIRETLLKIIKTVRLVIHKNLCFDAKLSSCGNCVLVLCDKDPPVSLWKFWDGLDEVVSGQISVDDGPGVNWNIHEFKIIRRIICLPF